MNQKKKPSGQLNYKKIGENVDTTIKLNGYSIYLMSVLEKYRNKIVLAFELLNVLFRDAECVNEISKGGG